MGTGTPRGQPLPEGLVLTILSAFVATLEGGRLMYGYSFSSTELTINGKQARGTRIDNIRLAIEMTRTK
jgi:hypothetical protein